MCPALPVELKKNNFWRKKSSFKKSTIFEPILPPRNPWVSSKNVSQFGPAVWPAIVNKYICIYTYKYIHMSKELNYIDIFLKKF